MKKIILLTIICLLMAPGLVLAQGKEQCGTDGGTWLAVPIFGTSYKNRCIKNPAEYVQKGYSFGIALVGIVAVIMIMIGGYQYMISAGNASQMSNAKDRIKDAILGLILALLSYLILSVLNPDLVNLKWNNEGLLGDVVQESKKSIITAGKKDFCTPKPNTEIDKDNSGQSIILPEEKFKLYTWLEVDKSDGSVSSSPDGGHAPSGNLVYYKVISMGGSTNQGKCRFVGYNQQLIDGCASDCQSNPQYCVNESCSPDSSNGTGSCLIVESPNVETTTQLNCKP